MTFVFSAYVAHRIVAHTSTVLAEPEGLINIYHLKARHSTHPPVTSSQSTPYDQYNITILSPPWPFKWIFSDTISYNKLCTCGETNKLVKLIPAM